ncbi:MAG: heavy metal translocating P-type ATPase [Deltaproteobacteria bacterium]|nr:heavy metal translocating P-type ATPase [Deltaproteobacteria bacterium]
MAEILSLNQVEAKGLTNGVSLRDSSSSGPWPTPEVEIVHSLPGRMRVRVRRIRYDSNFAAGVKGYLSTLDGVVSARIAHEASSAIVEFSVGQTNAKTIVRAISSTPFTAILAYAEQASAQAPQLPAETDETSKRPMYLATAGAALSFFGGPLSVFAYPLIALPAIPIFRRAWEAITRHKRLNIDFLDALSITAAAATGDVINITCIVWLICVGDYVRDLTRARSRRAIRDLLEYEKTLAWVVRNGKKVQIPAKEICVGDIVVVYTGSCIPVDGVVIDGEATVDQQILTGESLPIVRGEGDKVFAATTVKEGKIYLRAEEVAGDTKAANIVRLVENAPIHETRSQNYAEKMADRLVLPSLVGATAVSVATMSITRFAAIVTVDFGTGVRVSAPTAVLASMTASAHRGVLIKGGAYLEKLAQVSVIIFDKTGTLTHGVLEVQDVISHNGISEHQSLALAAAVSDRQTHPVSQAVCRKARSLSIEVPQRESSQFHVGRGVEAEVNGNLVHLGSARFMGELGICSNVPKTVENLLFDQGKSLLYLAVDGEHAATFAYQDKLRQESAEVIRALRSRGIEKLVMLTGDNEQVAARVSGELGLTSYYAEMLPEDKARVVQEFQAQGHIVAVVGDGINDSPALSYADVGISIRSGAEIARETAGVVLMEEDLFKLVEAVDTSREAMNLIKQNYMITMGSNGMAYFCAAFGWMSPITSTLVSNGSAVLACLNGIRPVLRQKTAT